MTWYLKQPISLQSNNRLYNCLNPIVGLTGGIASGKSTAVKIFSQMGFKTIDADKLIKNIYQKKEVLQSIRELFPFVFDQDNINFTKLREHLFNDPSSLKKVENILYPFLLEEFHRNLPPLLPNEVIIYEIPLLFEKRLQEKLDNTILVYIPKNLQIDRLTKRTPLSLDQVEKILNQQMDIELKKDLTMNIIHNNLDANYLKNEIDNIIAKLFAN